MKLKKFVLTKKKLVIIIVLTICVVIGFSYAFFEAITGEGAKAGLDVSVEQPDLLDFNIDKDLALAATQFSLTENGKNLTDTATGTVSLRANNTNNQATKNYNVYFLININNYIYTTADHKPEIVLTITKPDGTPLTTAEGLDYVTAGSVSGFDVTTKQGLFKIASGYEIKSTSSKVPTTQEWIFTLNFINLTTNQKDNGGKEMQANIVMQEGELTAPVTLKNKIISTYGTDTNLLLHDASLENGAGDNNYRYSGANPNNYVCFGSDETTCPADNLYRIIGVFGNNVKLIKATAATNAQLGTDGAYKTDTTYRWDREENKEYNNYNNTWSHSLLNITNLNTNYVNNIGSTWAEKIATTTWQVGGLEFVKIKSPNAVKDTYDAEVGASKTDTPYSAKIGLMYLSDYGYGASQEHWTKALFDYDNATTTANNWMSLGSTEWTISRNADADFTKLAFYVDYEGYVRTGIVNSDKVTRPVFYLTSDVTYQSGTGTDTDPYRISSIKEELNITANEE